MRARSMQDVADVTEAGDVIHDAPMADTASSGVSALSIVDDSGRLASLRRYDVLHSPAEPAFDDVARLAAQICGTPLAMVTFVDDERCWIKGYVGVSMAQVSRTDSFCTHTIQAERVLVIEDAQDDERFSGNSLVTSQPGIRFYAGAPIITPDGFRLGAVAVGDYIPRRLTNGQLQSLERLARQVITQLELRRGSNELALAIERQRQAEAAARASEGRLRALLDNAPGGVLVVDTHAQAKFASSSIVQLLGYTPEELTGQNVLSLVHPEDFSAAQSELARVAATPDGRGMAEFRGRHKDGSWRWIAGVAQNLMHEPAVGGIACNFWDISERKAAEAKLRDSESRFRRIMDSNMVGILFWNADGSITDANERFLQMIGYTRADLEAGRIKWSDLTPAEHLCRDQAALGQIARDGVCDPFEKEYIRKDGTRIPVFLGGALLEGYTDRGVCFVMEVSDRKRVEAELLRERNLLRTLIDHVPDYIYVKDRESRHLVNNRANVRLMGAKSVEETIGKTVLDFFPPDMAQRYLDADRELFESGREIINREESIVGGDGEPRWISTTKVPLRDPDGNITGLVGISRDVTEHKRAQEVISRQRNLFRSTLDNLPLCVFVVDRDARFIVNNRAHLKLFGLENPDQVRGKTLTDIAPPEPAARELADIRHVIETGVPILNCETTVIEASGRKRIHLFSKVPMLAPDGTVNAVIGISQDITERHAAQAQIEKLAAFPKFNPNPVFEFSAHGDLTYFNAAAQAMTTLVDKLHPSEILPPNTAEVVKNCLATSEPRLRLESNMNGRTISWSFFPIPLIGVVHCYAGDITERLTLETRLRHAQRMESVGQLAGGVAHDFNNILTVIQGHASLMLAESLNPDLQDSAEQISSAAERATNLTRQLLAFSRRQVLQPRNLDLNEVVATIAKMLQRVLGEDIALNVRYSSNLPPVHADPGMMEQVIVNLVVNSRDAMPKGGRLDITLRAVAFDAAAASKHSDARPGTFVVLRVADTGCGIPAEHLDRIFEPFFTTKDVGRGTGLGLATVYGIVKQHQGWIQVESEMGRGTTFEIFLPASPQKTATFIADTSKPVTGGSECILLVEDEPSLRELVRVVLESFGYRVIEAASGRLALEVWKQHRNEVDMLLTDIVMPEGVSGRDLADVLKQDKPELRVLFSSGYSSEIVGKDFVLREGINFLQKPYNPQTLAQTVRDCLDR